MSKLAEILDRARSSVTYLAEELVLQFIYDVDRCMQERKLTQADIAKKLEASPAYVSKLLRGDGNLTLRTVVGLADAVGARVSLQLSDKEYPLADMEWTAVNESVYFPNEVKNYEAREREEWKEAA